MIDLKNKVSLVTGGSRGIGAAIARLLATAGSDVVINYHRHQTSAEAVADDIRALGRRVLIVQGDVSREKTARELIETAIRFFDRIDILVNNAGIWTYGETGAMTPDVWDRTIDVNLNGVFYVCNAAIPYLKKSRGGRIVNVTSTAGQRGEAFHAHYAASKGGVAAFSKSLAVELAPSGILVNCVAPGWVDTEMNADVFADSAFKQKAVEGIPLRKIATAEDVAGAVLFLVSGLASHVTGSTINVNGGSVLY